MGEKIMPSIMPPVWVVKSDEEKRRFKIMPKLQVTGIDAWPKAKRDWVGKIAAEVRMPLIVNVWPHGSMGLDAYLLDANEWLSVDWGRVDAWVKLVRGHSGSFVDHASYAGFNPPVQSRDGTMAILDELVNRVILPSITPIERAFPG